MSIPPQTKESFALNLGDPVIHHLRQDFPRLFIYQTVGEALNQLRRTPPSGPIIYFYVTDDENHLEGIVSGRTLILEPYERPLRDVLIRSVITLPPKSTIFEACELFITHKLMALPIVDEKKHILGTVDLSLCAAELTDLNDFRRQNDLFQRVGVHISNARPASSFSAFRLRFPWLGCNLAAGILAAFLSGIYQRELSRAVALAFFIPVVLNLGESVSSQSVSLAIELLHSQSASWGSMLQKLKSEALTGLMLGLGSGSLVALFALVWLGQTRVALCLIGGITAGVTGAALLGLMMPYTLRLFRLDPKIAAGPIALAGTDVITILIYLNLARILLG